MEKSKDKYVYYISLLIFLLVTHDANYQLTRVDGYGRFEIILSALSFMYLYRRCNLKQFVTAPLVTWMVLMIYHRINAYFCGVDFSDFSIVSPTLFIFFILLFTPYLYIKNKELLFVTLICSYIWQLYWGYRLGEFEDYSGRLTGFIYTTQLGQMSGVACCIIAMYSTLKNKASYLLLMVFPIFIMFLAGARNGTLVVAFSLLCALYPYVHQKKSYLILAFILLVIFYNYFESSAIMERFQNSSEVELEIQTGTFLDYILGDRTIYYLFGFQNFLDHPINGIGLFHFRDYNQYIYALHTEPMTHLAEGGIIGFSLYLYYKFYFIKGFRRYWDSNNFQLVQNLIVFVCLMILGLTARIFHYPFFFPLYGIMIGEFIRIKNEIEYE